MTVGTGGQGNVYHFWSAGRWHQIRFLGKASSGFLIRALDKAGALPQPAGIWYPLPFGKGKTEPLSRNYHASGTSSGTTDGFICIRRIFHIDADEVLVFLTLENAFQICAANSVKARPICVNLTEH